MPENPLENFIESLINSGETTINEVTGAEKSGGGSHKKAKKPGGDSTAPKAIPSGGGPKH